MRQLSLIGRRLGNDDVCETKLKHTFGPRHSGAIGFVGMGGLRKRMSERVKSALKSTIMLITRRSILCLPRTKGRTGQ